jgi:hypothetical protein
MPNLDYLFLDTPCSGLYNAMYQIAKSENIVDYLQFAELAGCKTKSVEEFSVIFAGFNSCKLYFTGPVHMIPLAEMSRLTGRIFPCVHMGRLFKR